MTKNRAHYQRVVRKQVSGLNPGAEVQPITPGLTPAERQARWKERMPWPDDYFVQGPRLRRTPLADVAAIWV
jgi:hypothetical protein